MAPASQLDLCCLLNKTQTLWLSAHVAFCYLALDLLSCFLRKRWADPFDESLFVGSFVYLLIITHLLTQALETEKWVRHLLFARRDFTAYQREWVIRKYQYGGKYQGKRKPLTPANSSNLKGFVEFHRAEVGEAASSNLIWLTLPTSTKSQAPSPPHFPRSWHLKLCSISTMALSSSPTFSLASSLPPFLSLFFLELTKLIEYISLAHKPYSSAFIFLCFNLLPSICEE